MAEPELNQGFLTEEPVLSLLQHTYRYLEGQCCYSTHFADEETEALRGKRAGPCLEAEMVAEPEMSEGGPQPPRLVL